MNRRLFLGLMVLGLVAGPGCDRSDSTGTAGPVPKPSGGPAQQPAEGPRTGDETIADPR